MRYTVLSASQSHEVGAANTLKAALEIAEAYESRNTADEAVIVNNETNQKFSTGEASGEPETNDLAHDASHECAECFNWGRHYSTCWEPDDEFIHAMLRRASELSVEIESIEDLSRLCRDAYGYYWDSFENEAYDNPEMVTWQIDELEAKPDHEWSDDDAETYTYLIELRNRISA